MNTAEVIIDVLDAYGVKFIFGIPGDAINNLIEAIRKQNKIKFIQVRHEEAGALAASAHAKLTGQLGVCLGTSGPGAIHLLNGLYDAKADHAPVLALTGQATTDVLGTEYNQEVDLHSLFKDVSEYTQTVVNPAQMPGLIIQACKTALARRSVTHLAIPADIAEAKIKNYKREKFVISTEKVTKPSDELIREAAVLLNSKKRITILAGIGACEAREELIQLAETLQAPVVRTLRAKDLIPDEHPLSLGGIGLLGTEPAMNAMKDCDLLMMVGTDFPYFDFYPDAKTPAIQIDIDPHQIGKRHPVEVGLTGQAKPTLQSLLLLLEPRHNGSFLKKRDKEKQSWNKKQGKMEHSEDDPIHPQSVAYLAGELAREDAVFLCDTGNVTVWAARHLHVKNGQRFSVSGGMATMGFALPAAIAAQLDYPERQVIALCGDGGFHMMMSDFITAVKYQLPIKVVIFNNCRLGMIQMEQEVEGNPKSEVNLMNPDYGAFARICGADGINVTHFSELEPVLAKAFASPKPFIINVFINPDEVAMPPKVKLDQAIGYGTAKIKEALGKGDDKGGFAVFGR